MTAFSDVEHPWSWLHREEIKCSCCSVQINPFNEWFRHPVMQTIQCQKCHEFYIDGEFTKDADGYYEHWDVGGSLYGCDYCIESFCKQCILRNLGRTAVTEIESGSKWHCYICKPEKFKEPRAHAKKVAESAKLHAKWVESKELDSERRKLEKFEKKKKIINDEKIDGGESTDAEDLEIKVIKLLQTLERVVEQAERPIEKKRRFSKIVTKNHRKFSSLRTKARKTVQSMTGNGRRTMEVDLVASSDDEADAELIGLKKPKKVTSNGTRAKKAEVKKPSKRKSQNVRSPKPKPPPKAKKSLSRIVLKKKSKKLKLESSDDEEEAESSSSSEIESSEDDEEESDEIDESD